MCGAPLSSRLLHSVTVQVVLAVHVVLEMSSRMDVHSPELKICYWHRLLWLVVPAEH